MSWGTLWALFVLSVMGCTLLVLGIDETEWVKTDDPNCYLRVHQDLQILHADTTTRIEFCRKAALEPYGGCDEAARYIGSAGHTWCALNGRL